MRGHEEVPLRFRPALRDHPSHGVALAARVFDIRIGLVRPVDEPPFHLEAAGAKLLGRDSVVVGQVAYDVPGSLRLQLGLVQRDHAADRLLPAFGRLPQVRDARHHPVLVDRVAAVAGVDERLIRDGDAGGGVGRLLGGSGGGEQERQGERNHPMANPRIAPDCVNGEPFHWLWCLPPAIQDRCAAAPRGFGGPLMIYHAACRSSKQVA